MVELTEAIPVPDHIPPEAVFDFDLRADPGLIADPHARLLEVHEQAPPVFWTPRNGGRWVAFGYDEVYEVARDPERFCSSYMPPEQMAAMMAMMPKDMPRIPMATPITMDPPEHGKYRAPLQGVFSPKSIMARKESIQELAAELIDAVAADGHCDFIPAIAEPLPVKVFLKMMGLPEERLGEFRDLVHEFLERTLSGNQMEGAAMSRKVADAMLGEIMARKDDPKDDIISMLWATEIEGEPTSLELMEDYCVLLFIAGLDTVINAMGFAIRHLALNPDLQDDLRAHPEKIQDAVEEMLRRYSIALPMRRVAKDLEFAGWQMKAGEWVMLHYAGADLDSREFEGPDDFTLDRENNVHLAFGAGVHRCIGSHLARIELQVLYAEVLARLPKFRLDPDKPATFHSGNIIAVDSLPIRWD